MSEQIWTDGPYKFIVQNLESNHKSDDDKKIRYRDVVRFYQDGVTKVPK